MVNMLGAIIIVRKLLNVSSLFTTDRMLREIKQNGAIFKSD